MKALTYGFVDRFEDSSSTWGATIHHLRAMIVVDVNIIKNLMGNQITLAERCLLQFILAVTVRSLPSCRVPSRKVDLFIDY